MRPALRTPFDPCKFQRLLPLAENLYCLHAAGSEYGDELEKLSRLAARVVGKVDVLDAFGAIGPDEFAKRLAIDWHAIPTDLSGPELLQLLDAICEGQGSAVTLEYWVECLALNTGDDKISDLIYWPEEYFDNAFDGRELTSAEMLDIALNRRRSG